MRKRFGFMGSRRILTLAGVVLVAGVAASASLIRLPEPFVSHLFNSNTKSKEPANVVRVASPPVTLKPEEIEVLPQAPWIDSVFASMTLDEKIGQLFMVSAYSNRRESEYKAMENLVRDHALGGVLFFQGGPARQAALTNRYQSVSKVPLLIGLDAEWGLGMRLDSTISYPRQMTLGGIKDNQLLSDMGEEIGRQLKRIGVHVNFAPVADINSNPRNPVIGNRSFGDDKANVAAKASAYMKGLQRQGVIAVAKHFPGHGDTEKDSHHTLPVVNHSKQYLIEKELFPFRRLIKDSITAIMSGHLHVPALDGSSELPSSLSKKVLDGVLRKEMGFKGLVFTDAMNMKGVLKAGKPSEVNLKAILAGNDIVLAPEGVVESILAVKKALEVGTMTEAELDQKVKRILRAKYFAGLHEWKPIDLVSLKKDINSSKAQSLKRELAEASVAVIRNESNLLPLRGGRAVALISVGEAGRTPFLTMMSRFGEVRHFDFAKGGRDPQGFKTILKGVESAEAVVVAFHSVTSNRSNGFNVYPEAIQMLDTLDKLGKKTVACVFGSPYALEVMPRSHSVLIAYQNDVFAQEAAAQILYGALEAEGQLAISVGNYKRGAHQKVAALNQLGYSAPDLVGLSGEVLSNIDYLANEGIAKKAFPGCQILVAHGGRIVFEKAYGTLAYDQPVEVTSETLYDLASVTKVVSTLQAVMLLFDQKKIALDQKVSFYLPELKGTDKQSITIKELLVHQAGLKSFYPKLWETTMLSPTELSGKYYRNEPDSLFSLRVSPTLYAISSVRDSVWKWIIESPIAKRNAAKAYPYVYSDLGFMMLQKVVERVSGMPLDAFVTQNFYTPLGLERLTYEPLERFSAGDIAPTEDDNRYRGELLQGTVHDQMAALYGGVAGHAGLFGNCHDLAVLLQMNLWNGGYQGKRYIQPETIALFAKYHGTNRGLGWNKPRGTGSSSFVSELASASSYGHTGFTGNIVWVDPEKDLLFIFLSNRVNPKADNNRINALKTRKRIHDVIYEALLRSETI
jgi:beta-N-acetylhexosaminidase